MKIKTQQYKDCSGWIITAADGSKTYIDFCTLSEWKGRTWGIYSEKFAGKVWCPWFDIEVEFANSGEPMPGENAKWSLRSHFFNALRSIGINVAGVRSKKGDQWLEQWISEVWIDAINKGFELRLEKSGILSFSVSEMYEVESGEARRILGPTDSRTLLHIEILTPWKER